MPAKTYVYRVQIQNNMFVYVEKVEPDGKVYRPRAPFRLQKDAATLQFIQELHDKARAAARDGMIKSLTPAQVKGVGEALFRALFDANLQKDFVEFYRQKKPEDQLRFELEIEPELFPYLAALPWEFMAVPDDVQGAPGLRLAAAADIIFCRSQKRMYPPETINLDDGEKLRIALVVATPRDLSRVRYEKVQSALQLLAQNQMEQIEIIELVDDKQGADPDAWQWAATWQNFKTLLQEKKPHILHFIGHGRFLKEDGKSPKAQLALVNTYGDATWIDADEIGRAFLHHKPGVVVLQACEGAATAADENLVGLAAQIIQQDIPVVIGMQYEIPNHVAQRFATIFYEHLAAYRPVAQAVQKCRKHIEESTIGAGGDKGINQHFALPVIFMAEPGQPVFGRIPQPGMINLGDGNGAHSDTAQTLPQRLSQALFNLNYIPQRTIFRDFVYHGQMGAFIVAGADEDSGQHWLLRPLRQQLPQRTPHDLTISLKMGSTYNRNSLKRLWRELNHQLGLERNAAEAETIQELCHLRQTQNVFIVLDNVDGVYEGYINQLVADFWKPMVIAAQKEPSAGSFRLIMFLVDHGEEEGEWDDDGFATALKPGQWQPEVLVRLPSLPSAFSQDDLEGWLNEFRYQVHPLYTQAPTLVEAQQLATTILADTDGVPIEVLYSICDMCEIELEDLLEL